MKCKEKVLIAVLIGILIFAIGISVVSDDFITGIIICVVGISTISVSILYYIIKKEQK